MVMPNRWASFALAALLATVGVVSNVTQAAESAWGAGFVAEPSSNISLVPVNEQRDSIVSGVVGAAYRDRTTDFQLFLDAVGEYRTYANDTYPDVVTGIADAIGIWHALPRRFAWIVEDTLRELPLDAARPFSGSNRTNINVLNTGPDFYLRFSSVSGLQFGGRLGHLYDSEGNTGNTNYNGYTRLIHAVSPVTALSLNYEYLTVRMDDTASYQDYSRADAFVGLLRRLPSSVLTLELGNTWIDREDYEQFSGWRGIFSYVTQTTHNTAFGASARARYSDTATDMLSASRTYAGSPALGDIVLDSRSNALPLVSGGMESSLPGTVSGDIYYDRSGEIYYRLMDPLLSWLVRGFWQELDYKTSLQDRQEYGGSVHVVSVTTQQLNSSLLYTYRWIDYLDLSRKDQEQDVGVQFDYRLQRALTLQFGVRYITHDSSDPAREFRETRGLVSLVYSSAPFFNPLTRRIGR